LLQNTELAARAPGQYSVLTLMLLGCAHLEPFLHMVTDASVHEAHFPALRTQHSPDKEMN
jgi:hypothetical protein